MKKLMLLSSVLLLSASWIVAQQYPSHSSGQTSTQTSSDQSGKQTKVQGCLSGSDGNYTLTDKSGTAYQLKGDTSQLKEHVGHEIQVTGTTSGETAGQTGTTGGATEQTLHVSSMKHISASCSSR